MGRTPYGRAEKEPGAFPRRSIKSELFEISLLEELVHEA